MRVRVLNTSDRRIAADARRLARALSQQLTASGLRLRTPDSRLLAVSREPSAVCVNVVLVDDRRMRELNRRYRKQDRPTDVLSFPLWVPDEPPRTPRAPRVRINQSPESKIQNPERELVLGEVYVSRDRARAQAREHGVSYHEEVRRLVLHGMLHLLGFSHRQMEAWYERCLQ